MAVERSELVTSLEEAREYYRANLAGVRRVTCCEKRIDVVFPADGIHLYSESPADPLPEGAVVVRQRIAPGRFDDRVFSISRAKLMDYVLPAISNFTVSIVGQGAKGRENKVLHGPRLPSGDHMRVVLRPGPEKAWTCVSAFPVSPQVWQEALRAKRAKFPP